MALHDAELLVGESAWFVEDHIGDGDLAHIVERCGVDDLRNVFLRQLIAVDTLLEHLTEYDFSICGSFENMIAGALVTALDHIGEHHDQTVLQLSELFALMLDLFDVKNGIMRRSFIILIERFDLVAGANIQRVEHADPFLSRLGRIIARVARDMGDGVDRLDDMPLRQPHRVGADQDQEAQEQRDDLGEKGDLIGAQTAHLHIDADIAFHLSRTVFDGLIDRQQPAVLVICDVGRDRLTR